MESIGGIANEANGEVLAAEEVLDQDRLAVTEAVPDFDDGLLSQEILDAARLSSDENRWVDV